MGIASSKSSFSVDYDSYKVFNKTNRPFSVLRFGVGSGSDGGGGGGIGGGGIGGGRGISWDDPLLKDSSIIMFLDAAHVPKRVCPSVGPSVCLSIGP